MQNKARSLITTVAVRLEARNVSQIPERRWEGALTLTRTVLLWHECIDRISDPQWLW